MSLTYDQIKLKLEQLNRLKSEIQQVASFKNQLDDSYNTRLELKHDVEHKLKKLNGFSFSSLMKRFKGTNEAEKQELQQQLDFLSSKTQQDSERVKILEKQLEVAQLEVDKLEPVINDFNSLIEDISQKLIQENDERFIKLDSKVEESKAELELCHNKIVLGNEIVNDLEKMKEKLQKAKEIGYFDLAGGGPIISKMKHDKLKDVKEMSDALNSKFDAYYDTHPLDNSLNELSNKLNIDEKITQFDILLDNIFTDVKVQENINESFNDLIKLTENFKSDTKAVQDHIIVHKANYDDWLQKKEDYIIQKMEE